MNRGFMNKLYERNIKLSYVIGALMWGRFFIPVLALFYIYSKVSLEQFTIIMSVFAFTTLILEIPTGVLADLLGRKKTLLLSRGMYIIEIVMIAFFNGFWVFLVAKIISGIGVSLGSGTDSAMTYDSLKRLRRTNEHKKVRGMQNFISNLSMAVVFIVGAYLFTINGKLPAIVSLPLIILGFILTFFLKEPYEPKKVINFANYFGHLWRSIKEFWKNSYLKYLAFFTFFIGSAVSMMLSFSSAYYDQILIPVYLIGVVAFVGNILTAFSSRKAHQIEEKLGERKSLIFIKVGIMVAILLMSLLIPYYGIVFLLILQFVQGFYEVILSDYTNRHVGTKNRATMLSINNMFDNIGIAILFPVLGYLNRGYSMGSMLLYFGLFVAFCVVVSLIYYSLIRKSK